MILFNKRDGRRKKKEEAPEKKLAAEKRLGNEGAVTRGVAFAIHFHGWLAQTLKSLLRLWTCLDIYFPTDDNTE